MGKINKEVTKAIEPLTLYTDDYTKDGKNILRLIVTFSGLALAVVGVLCMLTIILILPGIGAVLIGLVVAIASVPKVDIDCPVCGIDNKIPLKSKQLKCEGCDNSTPVRWLKRR